MTIRRLVAVVLSLFLLAACAEAPGVTRSPGPATSSNAGQPEPDPQPDPQSSVDLAALKKAARIEDCPTSDAAAPAVASGLPDVTIGCLGGGRKVRLAGLRGRPMIINVWAQWCPPCREEAPYFTQIAAQHSSAVALIGVDYQDPRSDLAIEFARASSWTYPQLQDTDQVLAQTMQITGPPVTLFVRPDGTLAGRHAGGLASADQIRALSKQYLGVAP
jgi:cytochrome c biogenesis protein CcmG, thiol:disulfide interchange protein DsbE